MTNFLKANINKQSRSHIFKSTPTWNGCIAVTSTNYIISLLVKEQLSLLKQWEQEDQFKYPPDTATIPIGEGFYTQVDKNDNLPDGYVGRLNFAVDRQGLQRVKFCEKHHHLITSARNHSCIIPGNKVLVVNSSMPLFSNTTTGFYFQEKL